MGFESRVLTWASLVQFRLMVFPTDSTTSSTYRLSQASVRYSKDYANASTILPLSLHLSINPPSYAL